MMKDGILVMGSSLQQENIQLQLYLVLLFYHVVLEELVAIGTGAKPRFCSLIHIF